MNKTPEEILNECATIDGQTIQEFCLKAMLQYGKQQYNQAIKDAAENAEVCFTEDCVIVRGDAEVDKGTILKLLKP